MFYMPEFGAIFGFEVYKNQICGINRGLEWKEICEIEVGGKSMRFRVRRAIRFFGWIELGCGWSFGVSGIPMDSEKIFVDNFCRFSFVCVSSGLFLVISLFLLPD